MESSSAQRLTLGSGKEARRRDPLMCGLPPPQSYKLRTQVTSSVLAILIKIKIRLVTEAKLFVARDSSRTVVGILVAATLSCSTLCAVALIRSV